MTMTPEERKEFDEMKAQVAQLSEILGLKFYGQEAFTLRAALADPKNELPGGRLPLLLSDVQIRDGIAAIGSSTNSPPTTTSAVVQTPAPIQDWPLGAYKRQMRPLTNAEQRNAIDALVRGGQQALAETIELNFTKGVYPVCDPVVVEAVMEVRWASSTPQADKDALDILLSAIDQRIPNGDGTFSPKLLPLGDPRIVPISGTLNSSAPSTAPVSSAQVVYSENVVMVNPETGFTISVGMSKNDDGLSILYNYAFPWNGGASSNPKLPQMLIRMERDGGVSINGTAPKFDANGAAIPAGPWDGLRGKDIVFYPNGFDRDGKGKSEFVDIACMQAGRKVRLGASFSTASPTFPLEISPGEVTVNGRVI